MRTSLFLALALALATADAAADEPRAAGPAAPGTAGGTASAGAGEATTVTAAEKPTRFYFRGGVVRVEPLEVSQELELTDVDGPASLAVTEGPIDGSGSSVDGVTIPGLIVGWVTPWMDGKLSIEAVLGLPFTIEFRATGTLANESLAPEALGIPTGVPPLGTEIGKAKVAPPVLTGVYRPDRRFGPVQPYFGAGLGLLLTVDSEVTNPVLTEVSKPDLVIPPAPGLVFQGGLETRLWRRFYASADLKFIALMVARARVEGAAIRAPELPIFDTVEVGTAKMNVWVNPLIFQLSLGVDL